MNVKKRPQFFFVEAKINAFVQFARASTNFSCTCAYFRRKKKQWKKKRRIFAWENHRKYGGVIFPLIRAWFYEIQTTLAVPFRHALAAYEEREKAEIFE